MRILLGFLALFGVAGCSSTRAPLLSVQSADVTERTDDGIVVTFTMLADNPNPEPLPLRDASYSVTLAGKPVFSGTRSAQATVRRYGTQTFDLPAAFPIPKDGAAGTQPYVLHGTVKYLVAGALAETLFDIHVRRPSTDFRGSGVVDLSTVKAPTSPEIPGAKPPAKPPAKPATPPEEPPGPSPD
jgi:hypothetical protein